MSLYESPPETLAIGGVEYPIDTDFRAWVKFQTAMTKKGTDAEKAERLCAFMERMGLPPGEDAMEAMLSFYTAASTEKAVAGQKNRPAAFDFEKDSEYIFAAFKGAYGIDLTTARLHWWTFKALFKSLPEDCEFCRIMRYRTIDLKDVPKSQNGFTRSKRPGTAWEKRRRTGRKRTCAIMSNGDSRKQSANRRGEIRGNKPKGTLKTS